METVETKSPEVLDDKPQVVNADLRKFNKTAAMITNAVNALAVYTVIETKEQADAAMITLKEAKTVEGKIEAKRKELVKPFNDAVKKINDYAKTLVVTLPVAIDRVKNLVISYQKEEERKAAEALRKVRVQQLTDLGFVADGDDFRCGDVLCRGFVLNTEESNWIILLNDYKEAIELVQAEKLKAKEMELEDVAFFGSDEDVIQAVQEIETLAAPVQIQSNYDVAAPSKVKGMTKRWTFEITDGSQVPREFLMVDEKKVREAVNTGTRTIAGIRIFQQDGLTIR